MTERMKHDTEAELAVLGCMMHAAREEDDDFFEHVFEVLQADDFFDTKHQTIFATMEAMRDAKEAIDPRLVARHSGVEYAAGLLLEAIQKVTGSALFDSYAKLVSQTARQRRLVQAALDAVHAASHSEDSMVVASELQQRLNDLASSDRGVCLTTAADATTSYLGFLGGSDHTLPRTALPELDQALGGGVDYGEMVVIAARPSHGKTAVALQSVHNWASDGMPVLYISLEMSANALGKRIMQYSSSVPEEYWRSNLPSIQGDLTRYFHQRAEWFIADTISKSEDIAKEITRSVKQRGIKAVVVDYAQLIQSPGRTRYEQITYTSTLLRSLASEHRLVMLVLCQMSREIESRKKFVPIMSDIKESGQFEQDADVVVFLVWPHRINSEHPAHEYQFFVAKNRNRPILSSAFVARFEPSRQRVVSPRIEDMPNYEPAFEDYQEWNP